MRTAAIFLLSAAAAAGCIVRTVTLPPLQNLAVRGFVAHADREWPGTAEQQAQTVDTLDWLAAAIQGLADTRRLAVPNLATRVQELRALIKEFAAGNSDDVLQAQVLRRVFAAAGALVDDLVIAAGLESSGSARESTVAAAAESLDPTQEPRRQPDAIERYFQRASEALARVDRGM